MANEYLVFTGVPALGSAGDSSTLRTFFQASAAAFDKMPILAGNAGKPVFVNDGETGLVAKWAQKRKLTQAEFGVDAVGGRVQLTAGLTIPADTFEPGDWVELYNTTGANVTLTPGSGLTLHLHGSALVGARTFAQKGVTCLYFNSTTDAVVDGPDIT